MSRVTHKVNKSYGSFNETKLDHSITITENEAASGDYILLDDIKDEKALAPKKNNSKKTNPIISLVSYHEELEKCISIVEAAIAKVDEENQMVRRHQRRKAILAFFITELVLGTALGGLSYGCYQGCHDDERGAQLGYVVGLSLIGGMAALLGYFGIDCCDFFQNFKSAKYSFSPLEEAQLRICFDNSVSLSEIEIWALRNLLGALTKKLEKINPIIQAYQSQLMVKRAINKQEPNCALHCSFFKSRIFEPRLLKLIFESAGIDSAQQQKRFNIK